MPVLGGLMRDTAIAIPERHLGLVTREEHDLAEDTRQRLADMIESQLDLDRLLDALPEVSPAAADETLPAPATGPRVPIGVARDAAFCFYYPDNLELLEAAGADLVYFSPLAGDRLPDGLGGIYLGGGYPELHAATIAGNHALRAQIRELSQAGMPIYGECGGFMVLCRELGDIDGRTHPMTGCLPFATHMLDRLKALGYREVRLSADTILGPAGQTMRGHEFHYSALTEETGEHAGVYRLTDRNGVPQTAEGFVANRTLGSYVHLHFGSCPAAAGHFVEACRQWLKATMHT
jgi:cobyrinic acid a,c-diamide synthase